MNSKPYNVLIIDDDEFVARHIKKIFEEEGDIAHICTNPELALALAKQYMPQLIIIDVHMTPTSGFEVALQIRADKSLQDTPLVFISGSDDKDTGLLAFTVGATAFLKKPINARQLIEETGIMKDICQLSRIARTITGK
jgi:PleD family two-component response regulator